MHTIRAAIERRTWSGPPIGPSQVLTLDEALRAHAIDAAYALGLEDRISWLEPGKLADVTVADGDLVHAAPGELAAIDAWLTLVDGRVAHARDASMAW
jgi:predicted amidohydrolase YtcJ